MIHIIVSEDFDISTRKTAQWFDFYKEEVLIINKNEEVVIKFNNLKDIVFFYQDKEIIISEIKSIWFRRSRLKINYVVNHEINDKDLLSYHNKTKRTIEDFVNFLLFNNIISLGNPFSGNVNKLIVNELASNLGFKIPKSTLTRCPDELNTCFESKPLITKLLVPLVLKQEINDLNFLTMSVDKEMIRESDFSTSFFQEEIKKSFEVRVFYIQGNFFSKAIFSQNDDQTSIDYRNYNLSKPNREVPFNLPSELKAKLNSLMTKLSLDTGSIDFIVTPNNDFFFLEINPVGQFGDMSYTCNYYLEKKIVELLNGG